MIAAPAGEALAAVRAGALRVDCSAAGLGAGGTAAASTVLHRWLLPVWNVLRRVPYDWRAGQVIKLLHRPDEMGR